VHTPGHTKGHSALVIPEASAVFLGDIELSGFGPYYGDAWSDLEDFERSLERCRQIDVEHFITFHHKGTISSRPEFLEMLDKFAAAIPRREAAMLEFLREPHTLDEMVETRFIYRPHVESTFVTSVERRSAILHLERFVRQGRVTELEPGLWRATPGVST
jgi:glyoxylase-like metal-dependent hydrolase (beta-lactamase superfamily II)